MLLILAVPVVDAVFIVDSAAMGLDGVSAGVQPGLTGEDAFLTHDYTSLGI